MFLFPFCKMPKATGEKMSLAWWGRMRRGQYEMEATVSMLSMNSSANASGFTEMLPTQEIRCRYTCQFGGSITYAHFTHQNINFVSFLFFFPLIFFFCAKLAVRWSNCFTFLSTNIWRQKLSQTPTYHQQAKGIKGCQKQVLFLYGQ